VQEIAIYLIVSKNRTRIGGKGRERDVKKESRQGKKRNERYGQRRGKMECNMVMYSWSDDEEKRRVKKDIRTGERSKGVQEKGRKVRYSDELFFK
jgi:hypothetical protein